MLLTGAGNPGPVFLALLRLLVGAVILSYASYSDWRTRKVSDAPWVLMVGAGLALLATEVVRTTTDPLPYLILVPPAFLFLDVLWDRGGSAFAYGSTLVFYVLSILAVILLLLGFPTQGPGEQRLIRQGLGIVTVVLLGHLFYYVSLLKGGADAKAFMAIGLLVPGYPLLPPFPLLRPDPRLLGAFEVFFPFAMTTLLLAGLLLVVLPVAFLLRNLARGDRRWPQLLLGYTAPLGDLPRFAWALQEVEDGRTTYHVVPRKTTSEIDHEALSAAGFQRIWVTPQIPFLLPLTAGFLLAFLMGNPLFALF